MPNSREHPYLPRVRHGGCRTVRERLQKGGRTGGGPAAGSSRSSGVRAAGMSDLAMGRRTGAAKPGSRCTSRTNGRRRPGPADALRAGRQHARTRRPGAAKVHRQRPARRGSLALGGTLPRVPLRGDLCTGTAGGGGIAVAGRFEGRVAAHAEPGPVADHGHERAGLQVLPDRSGQDADGRSGRLRHGKDSSLRRCPVISGHAATVRRSGSSLVRNRLRNSCRHSASGSGLQTIRAPA